MGYDDACHARVAQLDRASASGAEGYGFNSHRAHQSSSRVSLGGDYFRNRKEPKEAGKRRIKTAIAFTDKARAIDFERYLKSSSGRAFAKKRL
jgi:hypothetical protein